MEKNNILKIIGAFVFIFGVFFLLLSITNIFNELDFVEQYKNCIEVSKYEPGVLSICKHNVSNGLNIAIRSNQVELTTGQYLKIYIKQIISVLFAVLLIILGDYIYVASKNKKEVKEATKPKEIKRKVVIKKKPVRKRKK
jgi:VIT1/CCC1 family predicted Fe2+/Mn2+ transporter